MRSHRKKIAKPTRKPRVQEYSNWWKKLMDILLKKYKEETGREQKPGCKHWSAWLRKKFPNLSREDYSDIE